MPLKHTIVHEFISWFKDATIPDINKRLKEWHGMKPLTDWQIKEYGLTHLIKTEKQK